MKNNVFKKLIVFILAFVMVVTYVPITDSNIDFASADSGLAIYHDGEPCDAIIVDQHDGEILSAKGLGINAKYQWQLRIKGTADQWVNIKDMNKDQCNVTYALVRSMLDENGSADIRCTATVGENEYISEPVTITVSYDVTTKPENTDAITEKATTPSFFSMLRNMPMLSSARASSEYVTITIKYVYENEDGGEGINAFDPYIASLRSGTDFTSTVPSPTIVGYEPWIKEGDNYVSAKDVELNYTNITENQTVTVRYRPALVNYKVRYYLQNTTDDMYTENTDLSRSAQGYTGDYPNNDLVRINIDGFSALYYQPERIAADGSTEFQCYYDRNYYLVNFDLNGGYGIEPIYARYETPFVVNTPVKHGYVFQGWDLADDNGYYDGVKDELPGTIPLGNQTYRAIWTAVDTTYTVVYWLEDANVDGKYNYLGSEVRTAKSASLVSGADSLKSDTNLCGMQEHAHSEAEGCYENCTIHTHTHTDACLSCTMQEHAHSQECKQDVPKRVFVEADQNVLVEGDGSTVVNVRYTTKTYTLKFYYARSSGTTYEVVGGTTYPFGTYNNSTNEYTSVQTLLENVTQWGAVQEIPEVNDLYKDRYTIGTDTYGEYTYYYLSFTERYGSDIENLWPIGIFNPVSIVGTHDQCSYKEAYFSAWNGEYKVKYTQDHAYRHGGNETIKGCYMYLDDNLLYDSSFADGDTVHYLGFWDNGANISWSIPELYRYNLWVESLDEDDEDGWELYKSFDTFDDSNTDNQTISNIKGFEFFKREDVKLTENPYNLSEAWEVNFYYKRQKHQLSFYNHGEVTTLDYSKSYGESLESEYRMPSYPNNLEGNAYEFGGWYTSPGCYDGTEVDWSTMTMPDNDLMLYAKWTPKIRTVKFYNQYSDIDNENAELLGNYTVLHGNTIVFDPELKTPFIQNRTFAGWFYMKNGEKIAFNPYEMPIRQDLNVFAEWTSSNVSEYTINYVLEDNDDNDDNDVKIADTLYGMTFAGQTKTFTAKTGSELWSSYSAGYFPVTSSHSIIIDEDKRQNVYTFKYMQLEEVPYTVRYVDKQTGLELYESKHVSNPEDPDDPNSPLLMVVTEKFQPIKDYMPDAYYKRLVLSATADENVITFYYLPDDQHAPYVIHHKIEGLDGTYSDYSVIQGIGDLNDEITATPLTITGFTYDSENEDNVTSGQVSADGLMLVLHYTRNTYPYTVRHLQYGTDVQLNPDKVVSKENGHKEPKYGSTVTESAIEITDSDGNIYDVIGEATKEYVIRDKDNVITFYYKMRQYTLTYIPVCTEENVKDCGVVDIKNQTVPNLTMLRPVTAMPATHYHFIGWYDNAECTGDPITTDASFKPNTLTGDKTYYALFAPNITSLTIKKSGMADNDSSIFNVKGTGSNSYIDMDVVITGNGSKDIIELPEGEYKITEAITQNNNWSWRYSTGESEKTITVTESGTGNKVEFTNTPKALTWLGGETIKPNKFN